MTSSRCTHNCRFALAQTRTCSQTHASGPGNDENVSHVVAFKWPIFRCPLRVGRKLDGMMPPFAPSRHELQSRIKKILRQSLRDSGQRRFHLFTVECAASFFYLRVLFCWFFQRHPAHVSCDLVILPAGRNTGLNTQTKFDFFLRKNKEIRLFRNFFLRQNLREGCTQALANNDSTSIISSVHIM